MKITANVVNLAAYKHAEKIPPMPETGGKIASDLAEGGNSESSQFAGVSAHSEVPNKAPPVGKGGKQKSPKGKGESPAKKVPKSHVPTVERTPGPTGYIVDCQKVKDKVWTLTTLKAAYPSEAMSWKKSKERAPKLGMKWDPAWNRFDVFLLDMKPKDSPDQTLDRTDPNVKAYGPGLCQWATPPEQNNNKTNNLKFWDPLLKKHLSSPALAELLKVPLTTIHKRSAEGWSILEMLAGKKDALLAHIAKEVIPDFFKPPVPATPPAPKSEFDDTAAPPKERRRKLEWPVNWHSPDADDYDIDDPRFGDHQRQHMLLYAWFKAWNAGEPCTLHPPKTVYFKARAFNPCRVLSSKGEWVSVGYSNSSPVPPTPAVLAQSQQWIEPPAPKHADSSEEAEVEEDDEGDEDDPEYAAQYFYDTATDEDFRED